MSVLALDFDGVLCDSARETGITGWKAAGAVWEDMANPLPPPQILDAFCCARPVIETGYEAIAMMRLLQEGADPHELLASFPQRLGEVVTRSGIDITDLRRLFGAVRDRWIEEDAHAWLSLSPLYPGAADILKALPRERDCYIVTTKQERFVEQLLTHNGVSFPAEHVFGLDRGLEKEAVLRELMRRHPGHRLHFVEDRWATLQRFSAKPDFATVTLHLACWGYNTEAERKAAEHLNIHLLEALNPEEFAQMEYDIDH